MRPCRAASLFVSMTSHMPSLMLNDFSDRGQILSVPKVRTACTRYLRWSAEVVLCSAHYFAFRRFARLVRGRRRRGRGGGGYFSPITVQCCSPRAGCPWTRFGVRRVRRHPTPLPLRPCGSQNPLWRARRRQHSPSGSGS